MRNIILILKNERKRWNTKTSSAANNTNNNTIAHTHTQTFRTHTHTHTHTLSAMFRTRFSPITASPTRPMSESSVSAGGNQGCCRYSLSHALAHALVHSLAHAHSVLLLLMTADIQIQNEGIIWKPSVLKIAV